MEKLWRCSVCNMIVEGENAPEKCPKCGAPRDKFVELSEEESSKVYGSDRTNDIHMEIITLASKIVELAKEGIEIDLDPGCKKAFENAKDEAWTIKQRCKAELDTHMKKGKW